MSPMLFFAIVALAGIALAWIGKAALDKTAKVVVVLIGILLVLLGGFGFVTALM